MMNHKSLFFYFLFFYHFTFSSYDPPLGMLLRGEQTSDVFSALYRGGRELVAGKALYENMRLVTPTGSRKNEALRFRRVEGRLPAEHDLSSGR